jgi:multidrug efflux system membrane fusion protein
VQSDRAALDVAKLNLDYSVIHSPIDGKTGPILVQPGNLVTANGTNPLVTITQIQPVKISFSLPQSDLPRIQNRAAQNTLTAAVDLHDSSGKPIKARVDFVSNAVSSTTGTIELRATFANADMRLVPGQLVDVSVALDSLPHAIVVPREAVNVGPDGRYVYVVGKDDNAELRQVAVLFDGGATIAISGPVRAGEPVITDGQLRVIPGKPVSIVKAAAPKAP